MEVQGAPCHVELHGFLGGPADFELLAMLCRKEFLQSMHAQSSIDSLITADNVALLHTASLFLGMSKDYETSNLLQHTRDFLVTMPLWSLSQCMSLLKSFDVVPYHTENVGIIQQCVGLISSKASSCSNASTPSCNSPNSGHASSESSASDTYLYTCLYEDITHLSIGLLENLMVSMISHHVDNKFLAKCLLHYLQTAKKRAASNRGDEAWSMMEPIPSDSFESVVLLLHKLDRACMSCRSLFGLQRMATKLQASKACRKKIEEMIGFQLDKATLDNILVSRRRSNGTLYDVNLILRLVKTFLRMQVDANSGLETGPVKRVGSLLDKYLAEIAPDPSLSGAKFKAVIDSLPEFARDSHDDLYQALDIYLEAHSNIEEEEVLELCKVIDFNKLSVETSKHMAQSLLFPARVTLQVLLQEQANLKAAMGHHHHQQHQSLQKAGDASPTSVSSSPLLTAPLNRQGSKVGCKHMPQHEQHTHNKIKAHGSHTQNLFSQHIANANTTQLGSPSTIDCTSTRSKSSSSWGLHSHSNRSSSKNLYEQMAFDLSGGGEQEQEQEEHEYRVILQENEELRTNLHAMQCKVSELEKACGQMKSKVSKYMRTRPLLC